MNIGLDKSSAKFECPACGKKRFVRYCNFETKEYFPSNFGRCDREVKCGYHNSIHNYFKEENVNYEFTPAPASILNTSRISAGHVKKSLLSAQSNNFIEFLNSLFDPKTIKAIVNSYKIGTSEHWPGAAIFWQIDNRNTVRSGKILLYDPITGKRIKKPYNHINWYHKTKKLRDFNLSQCLFRLHLVERYPRKAVALVESEKTAIIMSVLMPDSIWLASGSLSNIKTSLFNPICERKIILYPDASLPNKQGITCFDKWSEKARHLQDQGFSVAVSNLLELKTSQDQKHKGYDLADFFIPKLLQNSIDYIPKPKKTKALQSLNEQKYDHFKAINPSIELLKNTFDLDLS